MLRWRGASVLTAKSIQHWRLYLVLYVSFFDSCLSINKFCGLYSKDNVKKRQTFYVSFTEWWLYFWPEKSIRHYLKWNTFYIVYKQ